jgi:nicotinamidase-related amidase
MTLSSIDGNAALIVLDLQVATAALPTAPHPAPQIIERSARLARAFRAHGRPVVWVNVAGASIARTDVTMEMGELPENWTDFPDELGIEDTDRTLTKYGWGAFHDDRLENLLRELSVEQIVLTGLTTSQAVESTARSAYERNFHVVIVTDAIGDLDPDAHTHSVDVVFPKLSELATTDEVLAEL